MEEQEHKSDESIENNVEYDAKTVDANKIPKPVPSGGNTEINPSEHPLTEDTISIKRSDVISDANDIPVGNNQVPPEAGDQVPEKHPVKESTESDPAEEPAPAPEESAEPERKLKIFCYSCGQKLDLTFMEPFSEVECPSCSHTLIVPKWWDNYLLEEVCGIGGMAKVYRALDLALDREVAIKVLNEDIAENENLSKMFLHEARTAATLNHYAILPIYTCGEFEGKAYFVMQYMGGGSLEKELERDEDHPLTVTEAIKWLKDICEALDNARRHGIIHHDIKPGNFMLDDDRNVKIGDFGISQALYDSRSEELTELTKEWGSPEYVSPEKILTKSETYLGDIYSLGATFYHLLTKEPPFDNHDIPSMLKAKTIKDPIDIKKLRSDIPEPIAKLIMSMMDRTPEARPTYRDIVAELNSVKKASAPLAVKRKTGPIVPKKKPLAKKTPTSPVPMTVNKEKLDNFDMAKYGIKKKNPIVSFLKTVIFLGLLGYGGFYLWENGYLAGIIPNAPEPYKTDYLPEVTKLISAGKSVEAARVAKMKLNSGELSNAALKQAAIQLAINSYLNNDPDPAKNCKALGQHLLSVDVSPDSPEIVLLKYLYEKNADADAMRKKLLDLKANELMLVGEVAVFVKETYYSASKISRKEALKNYAALSPNVPADCWGLGWGKRIQKWYDWTVAKKGNLSDLEPLFRRTKAGLILMQENSSASSDNSNLSIDLLTSKWLEGHRAFAAARPKPEDYVFDEQATSAYIAGLPPEKRDEESKRLELISNIKFQLCEKMFIHPYKGIVQLADGSKLSGEVIGNSKEIMLHKAPTTLKHIAWSEVPVNQLLRMLAFYAHGLETREQSKAAREYLSLAVFADWYGKYKSAAIFAHKAVALDTDLESAVINYMMR